MRGDRSVVRAIRGPVVLITLGVLFALQNFTNIGFNQTWPVLLIVFGLLSLFGRAAPGAAPQVPPPPPPQYNWPPPAGGYRPVYSQSPYSQPGPPAGPVPPEAVPPGGTPPPDAPGSEPGGSI